MRWAGVACLGLAALVALALVWPSPRNQFDVSLSGDQMQTGWAALGPSSGAPDPSPMPSLTLAIDLPDMLLRGREERLGLVLGMASEDALPATYSLGAEVVTVEAHVTPPGESGQALRDGAAFEWTVVATQAPLASATLLVRLRRHSPQGAVGAEKLILARDITLPVRTVAGLSAPAARIAAAVLGLAGALLGTASILPRTH